MPLTDKISVLGDYIFDLMVANKVALGLEEVYFGDQLLVPKSPTACVEPDEKTVELSHTGFKVTNNFIMYVIIYHGEMQSNQVNRLETIQFAEAIVDFLHTDKQMGGLIVNGWCSGLDPGYAVRGKKLWQASRITWTGLSQTQI